MTDLSKLIGQEWSQLNESQRKVSFIFVTETSPRIGMTKPVSKSLSLTSKYTTLNVKTGITKELMINQPKKIKVSNSVL